MVSCECSCVPGYTHTEGEINRNAAVEHGVDIDGVKAVIIYQISNCGVGSVSFVVDFEGKGALIYHIRIVFVAGRKQQNGRKESEE